MAVTVLGPQYSAVRQGQGRTSRIRSAVSELRTFLIGANEETENKDYEHLRCLGYFRIYDYCRTHKFRKGEGALIIKTMAATRGLLGVGLMVMTQAHITQRPSMWHAPNDPSRDTAEDVSIDSPPWEQPRKLATCLTVRALHN